MKAGRGAHAQRSSLGRTTSTSARPGRQRQAAVVGVGPGGEGARRLEDGADVEGVVGGDEEEALEPRRGVEAEGLREEHLAPRLEGGGGGARDRPVARDAACAVERDDGAVRPAPPRRSRAGRESPGLTGVPGATRSAPCRVRRWTRRWGASPFTRTESRAPSGPPAPGASARRGTATAATSAAAKPASTGTTSHQRRPGRGRRGGAPGDLGGDLLRRVPVEGRGPDRGRGAASGSPPSGARGRGIEDPAATPPRASSPAAASSSRYSVPRRCSVLVIPGLLPAPRGARAGRAAACGRRIPRAPPPARPARG